MNGLSFKFNKVFSDNLTNVLNKFYDYKTSAHSKITPVLAKWSEAMPSWKSSTSANGPHSSISKKNSTSYLPNAAPLLGTLAVLGMAALYLKATPGTPLNSQGGAQTNLVLNPANSTMKDDLSLLDRHLETASLSIESVDLTSSSRDSIRELMSHNELNVSTLFSSVEYSSTALVKTTSETACENDTSPSNFSLPSNTTLSSASLKSPPATTGEKERSLSGLPIPKESPRADDDLLESLLMKGTALSFDAYSKADQLLGQFVDKLDPVFEKANPLFERVDLGTAVEKTGQLFEHLADGVDFAVEQAKRLPASIVATLRTLMPNHPGLKIGGVLGFVDGTLIAKSHYDRAGGKNSFTREFIQANLVAMPFYTGLGYLVENPYIAVEKLKELSTQITENLSSTVEKLKEFSTQITENLSSTVESVKQASSLMLYILSDVIEKKKSEYAPYVSHTLEKAKELPASIVDTLGNLMPTYPGPKIGAALGFVTGTLTAGSNCYRAREEIIFQEEFIKSNLAAVPLSAGIGFGVEKVVQFLASEIANPSSGTKIGAGVGAVLGTITAKAEPSNSRRIKDYLNANLISIPLCSGIGYVFEKTVSTINSLFWSTIDTALCPFSGSCGEKLSELGNAAYYALPLGLVIGSRVYQYQKYEKGLTALPPTQ